MPPSARIETRACPDWMGQEVDIDPPALEFAQRILVAAPVFKALEIAVKARPDVAVPFVKLDIPSAFGEHDRRGETRRTCADHCNGCAH